MSNVTAELSERTSAAADCFVIMPISDQASYSSGHFTRVYEDIISPAVEQAGFKPVRADQDRAANLIHLQILDQLLSAPMAVCDLSSLNPNVMFELGLRQAFDKPVVLIKDSITHNPFDISVLRHVGYEASMLYREVNAAVQAITGALIATRPGTGSAGVNSIVRLLGLQAAATKGSDVAPADARFELLEQKLTDISVVLRALVDAGFRSPQQQPAHLSSESTGPGSEFFESAAAAAYKQGINPYSPRAYSLRSRPTVTEQARAAGIDPTSSRSYSELMTLDSLSEQDKPNLEK